MNLLEQQLNYPLGETLPDSGQALEVAPGVRWIRMGLPFALNHINLWLLRDEIDGQAGWTIVDC
ncbi:MAG: MBL fold metallo-hydrolase, partial [Polaromonas sp.]|nr:MBL fold metallo-hydrolase [Polaromonas sp.]